MKYNQSRIGRNARIKLSNLPPGCFKTRILNLVKCFQKAKNSRKFHFYSLEGKVRLLFGRCWPYYTASACLLDSSASLVYTLIATILFTSSSKKWMVLLLTGGQKWGWGENFLDVSECGEFENTNFRFS